MATSGNYRKFYEKDGVKFSHTINPTGYPVQNRLLSVTVMTNMSISRWLCFALAMGVEKTKKLVDFIDDQLDVYLIYTDKDGSWKTYISPGIKKKSLIKLFLFTFFIRFSSAKSTSLTFFI